MLLTDVFTDQAYLSSDQVYKNFIQKMSLLPLGGKLVYRMS